MLSRFIYPSAGKGRTCLITWAAIRNSHIYNFIHTYKRAHTYQLSQNMHFITLTHTYTHCIIYVLAHRIHACVGRATHQRENKEYRSNRKSQNEISIGKKRPRLIIIIVIIEYELQRELQTTQPRLPQESQGRPGEEGGGAEV